MDDPTAYRSAMAADEDPGQKLVRWVNRGLDAFESAQRERRRRSDPVEVARARRHAALVQRQRAEQAEVVRQSRYRAWLRRAKVRATTATYVAGGTAGIGTLDAVAEWGLDAGGMPARPAGAARGSGAGT